LHPLDTDRFVHACCRAAGDAYGNRKFDYDAAADDDDWSFPSDEEEYEEAVLELREEMPKLADKLIRDPDHLTYAHKGGWSSPDHTTKAQEAPVLPIKAGKTYEVTSLPLDDWGHVSVRVEELDAEKMTVTLHRLKDDCDPCLFVRRGAKPSQEVYDKCTYQTWSSNERQHVVELEGLDVDVYYIGVWNTPIFGKNDAAFSIQVSIDKAKGDKSWVDEAEAMALELRVTQQQLTKLEGVFEEQKSGFASDLSKVREALVGCAERAASAGQEFAEDMGMSDEHVMFRALPNDPQRWVFAAPEPDSDSDDDGDGGLFGAIGD
jgi:hypothetical protein